MGFKDLFNSAKQKIQETIDKGNSEIKKYNATVSMSIYSKPVLGGFTTKKVFKSEDSLAISVSDFKDDDLALHTIFKLEEDDTVYVLTEIIEEAFDHEIEVNGKVFTYSCYKVNYRPLNDVFTEETMSVPYKELTEAQHDTLNLIQKKIEEKTLAAKEKKEASTKLWQYFTECISYQLKDHYVMQAFVKIADDLVDDFSSLLLKLFA